MNHDPCQIFSAFDYMVLPQVCVHVCVMKCIMIIMPMCTAGDVSVTCDVPSMSSASTPAISATVASRTEFVTAVESTSTTTASPPNEIGIPYTHCRVRSSNLSICLSIYISIYFIYIL